MIQDTLSNIERYRCLGERFGVAVDFLGGTELAGLETGQHEVQGEDVYVIVLRADGRPREGAKLEVHRKYADIQVLLAGTEKMGWKPTGSCSDAEAEFDMEKDAQFFNDEPDSWITMRPGQFAIFYPEDAHTPMISSDTLHKVVVKVALD